MKRSHKIKAEGKIKPYAEINWPEKEILEREQEQESEELRRIIREGLMGAPKVREGWSEP